MSSENRNSNHFLEKWYVDIIDEKSENVCILYFASYKYGRVDLLFSNVLQFLNKTNLISDVSITNNIVPILNDSSDELVMKRDDLFGKWKAVSIGIEEKVYTGSNGDIIWQCFLPIADGEILIRNSSQVNIKYAGLGYAERLTMTISPFEIPNIMDVLRWGRFLARDSFQNSHYVTWIAWTGKTENFLIYYNGKKYTNGVIDDNQIAFDEYSLMLDEKYVLRSGKLIDTAVKIIKYIIPFHLFNTTECKWQTKARFYKNQEKIVEAWSIHEKVEWESNVPLLKFGYGFIFTILLPILLILWAKRTEDLISLPFPYFPSIFSYFLILSGILLIISGMYYLWKDGEGLPMNAFPPKKLVKNGPYKFVADPIYIGSTILAIGVSLYYESKSGLWLITPLFTLGWLTLVYGFEYKDLEDRFKNSEIKPLFSLTEYSASNTQLTDIVTAYLLTLIPWVILYEIVIFIGIPTQPISTFLPFEEHIPVIEWTELFYGSAYVFVAIVPLILKQKRNIRVFIIESWINISIGIFLQFTLPFVAFHKNFTKTTIFGELIEYERATDSASAAFPSFHTSWAFLSAKFYGQMFPQYRYGFYLYSSLIALSCVATGMHSSLDVIAGYLLFLLAIKREFIWNLLKSMFQNIGNSWCSWQIGPIRIINHSIYAGLTGFIGSIIVCSLLNNTKAFIFVSIFSLISGCLWGQIVEGGYKGLSRPFGYFGTILGGFVSCFLACYLFNIEFIVILSAFAIASPWTVAVGRFRCIVQGCCHGKLTSDSIGIRITNEKSRVSSIANLRNNPIHITQAYSIFSNIVIGIILWRLWYANVSLALISGLYCILSGCSRFVEEQFRGEPQTPYIAKLKLYQWMSILSVIIGILLTCLPFNETKLVFKWKTSDLLASFLISLILAFSMGMDFPNSNYPFSRLANK